MTTELEEDFVQLSKNLQKQIAARERRARQERIRTATIALAVSMLGVISAAFSLLKLDKPKDAAVVSSTIQYDQLRAELTALKSQLGTRSPGGSSLSPPTTSAFEKRLASLEEAIMDRPDKALALPLLRKEIDDLSRRETEARTATRVEIDRLYEQQKWILGGIGTVLLAVAGGAISILFRSSFKHKGSGEE